VLVFCHGCAVILMQVYKIGNLAIKIPLIIGTYFTVPILNSEAIHSPGELCASLSNIGCDMLIRVLSHAVVVPLYATHSQ
jgi:hypothetical protein